MVCMVILTIQLLGWCWPSGIPFHYTLSVVSVTRVFGSGTFTPLRDIGKLQLYRLGAFTQFEDMSKLAHI